MSIIKLKRFTRTSLIVTFILGFFNDAWSQEAVNTTLVGRWGNGICEAVCAVGDIVYYGNGGSLVIVDFSDPDDPVELGKVALPSLIKNIHLEGDFAYVGLNKGGFRILDISDPEEPIEVGYYIGEDWNRSVDDLRVRKSMVYTVDSGLYVIDASNPESPVCIGFSDHSGLIECLTLSGDYAYMGSSGSGVRVIDISDSTQPTEVAFFDVDTLTWGFRITSVAVKDTLLYASSTDGLWVIDIRDQTHPTYINFLSGCKGAIQIQGDYAYLNKPFFS